jgi:hypothetical protein
MNKRFAAWTAALAAAGAALVLAATAGAATTQISGSFPNGGCGPTHTVTVGGPSRIEASVSSTSVSGRYEAVVVGASGNTLSDTGSYDTPGAGTYGVRVCSQGDPADPQTMQYNGLIGTGPAGQPALPRQSGGVAGAFTTFRPATKLFRSASGHGAVSTRSGLAWLTVRANNAGKASVRIDYASRGLQLGYTTGLRVSFGATSVRIAGHGIKIVVLKNGMIERFSINTSRLKTSGKVVRGGFVIA